MLTQIVADIANDVKSLQATALYERDTFEIHWSVCRTAKRGDFCQRCDDLDAAAFAAERAYLEASNGV